MKSIWDENLGGKIPVHDEPDSFIKSWSLVYVCGRQVCMWWAGMYVILSRMWCWSLRSVLRSVVWICS